MKIKQKNLNSTEISQAIDKLFAKNNTNISKEISQTIDIVLRKKIIGEEQLLNKLVDRHILKELDITVLDGFIFDKLMDTEIDIIRRQTNKSFPNGLIQFKASLKIDYQPLQLLLIKKKFQEADQLTQNYLCKLASLETTDKRKWLYFTDIASLPIDDLFIIDLLWRIYSEGKFGFSVQREIWILNNCNWEILWQKIGWIKEGTARRYPQEFIWTINAPKGHLPLMNQLRGTQVISSLFQHHVWQNIEHI